MKYRLIAFGVVENGDRAIQNIYEVEDGMRGCSTPAKAIAKLVRFAEEQGTDLTRPFEITTHGLGD